MLFPYIVCCFRWVEWASIDARKFSVPSQPFRPDSYAKLTGRDGATQKSKNLKHTSRHPIRYAMTESMRRFHIFFFLFSEWMEDAKREDRLLEILRAKQTRKEKKNLKVWRLRHARLSVLPLLSAKLAHQAKGASWMYGNLFIFFCYPSPFAASTKNTHA